MDRKGNCFGSDACSLRKLYLGCNLHSLQITYWPKANTLKYRNWVCTQNGRLKKLPQNLELKVPVAGEMSFRSVAM